MNDRFSPGMIEATRLTRAGRLHEATQLLQRLMRGEAVAHEDAGRATAKPQKPQARSRLLEQLRAIDLEIPRFEKLSFEKLGFERSGRSPARPTREPEPPRRRAFDHVYNHRRQLPPAVGQFREKNFANHAGRRAYKLYVPSHYHGQALPLVVMLHGCNQSPDDFAAGTRMNQLAEELSFFVVYPAQSAAANFAKCWNWFRPGHQQRGDGEPSLIAGITVQVMQDYAVDPRRIYVAGLSAGAAAAAVMGMNYPDLYAAIGVHSGITCGAASDLASAFAAMRRGRPVTAAPAARKAADGHVDHIIPTIVFHGDRDKTVHPCNGDQVVAQSRTTGILRAREEHGQVPDGHTYSRTLHKDGRGRVIFEQWVIHGCGHAWSGGSHDGSYTDPRGPDASREMLRFFLAHRRT